METAKNCSEMETVTTTMDQLRQLEMEKRQLEEVQLSKLSAQMFWDRQSCSSSFASPSQSSLFVGGLFSGLHIPPSSQTVTASSRL